MRQDRFRRSTSLPLAGTSATVGYFPAGGLRLHESGAFANVSTSGYGWSSARSSGTAQYAHYLGFNSTNVNPSGSNHRTYGFPVRCVQEEFTQIIMDYELWI